MECIISLLRLVRGFSNGVYCPSTTPVVAGGPPLVWPNFLFWNYPWEAWTIWVVVEVSSHSNGASVTKTCWYILWTKSNLRLGQFITGSSCSVGSRKVVNWRPIRKCFGVNTYNSRLSGSSETAITGLEFSTASICASTVYFLTSQTLIWCLQCIGVGGILLI